MINEEVLAEIGEAGVFANLPKKYFSDESALRFYLLKYFIGFQQPDMDAVVSANLEFRTP
jgi:hypothetical protein